jgi:hypothetical protein
MRGSKILYSLKAFIAICIIVSVVVPVSAEYAWVGQQDSTTIDARIPKGCSTDGNWTQEAKLVAEDASSNSFFGASVSIDGDYAIIGAFFNEIKGAAYIFKRTGTAWTQEAKLTAIDGQYGDQFGASVSINGDYAIVSAQSHNSGQGSAYVFHRLGTNWTQQSELTAIDGAPGDAFSTSVAIEGEYAVVGAPNHNGSGAVYVFKRTGTAWDQVAELTGSDAIAGDAFGFSVAKDDTSILVGARYASAARGAAYVFTSSGETWTQQAILVASEGEPEDQFGISVSIDGSYAIIGAGGNMSNTGYAYIFYRAGTTWVEDSRLVGSNSQISDGLGWSVSISGEYAIAGGPGGEFLAGSAYVFHHVGSTWVEDGKLTASDGVARDFLGIAVAISGQTAISGAFQKDTQTGAAYAFKVKASPKLSIGEIKGGFGITTTINNTGDADATNLSLLTDITGGLFGRLNLHMNTTISEGIPAGGSIPLKIGMFFGLGKIAITVSVSCAEGVSAEKTVNATQLLVYTRIIQK